MSGISKAASVCMCKCQKTSTRCTVCNEVANVYLNTYSGTWWLSTVMNLKFNSQFNATVFSCTFCYDARPTSSHLESRACWNCVLRSKFCSITLHQRATHTHTHALPSIICHTPLFSYREVITLTFSCRTASLVYCRLLDHFCTVTDVLGFIVKVNIQSSVNNVT